MLCSAGIVATSSRPSSHSFLRTSAFVRLDFIKGVILSATTAVSAPWLTLQKCIFYASYPSSLSSSTCCTPYCRAIRSAAYSASQVLVDALSNFFEPHDTILPPSSVCPAESHGFLWWCVFIYPEYLLLRPPRSASQGPSQLATSISASHCFPPPST